MFPSANAAMWFLPFVTPIAIWVAWRDLSEMRIPNYAVLALFAVFVVVGFFVLPLEDYGYRFIHMIVVLVFGFTVTTIGKLGAGDAKYAAAIAPFVVFTELPSFIILFSICTVFSFITHRLARSLPVVRNLTPDWKSWENTRVFPMGYPMGLTLVFYLITKLY